MAQETMDGECQRALEQARREAREAVAREREALAEVERAERRAVLLAEVSSVLSASLDYDTTLRTLVRLCAARVADWAFVYVASETGEVQRVELAHADPRQEDLARELRLLPFDPSRSSAVRSVLQTGQPVLIERLNGSTSVAAEIDPHDRKLMESLAFRSAMVVPLIARGRTNGALALLTSESDRIYSAKDLALTEELGRRAALALDNALLYQQAQEASRAKSDFLAVMSHELRTPLNAIMGYTDLLIMGVPEAVSGASARHVERIGASARHLLHLVEEILAFSRIQAGEEEVNRESVDLHLLVKDVCAGIRPLAEAKRLAFECVEPEPSIVLDTDSGKLRQALNNLLANAINFTPEGRVTLRVSVDADTVTFRVEDTGIGLAREHVDRIFEPFWQVEAASTRRVGGTGLGLTISRRFARLLGGDVTVTSEGQGRGSTFVLRIPRRLPARRNGRATRHTHGSPAVAFDR